MGAGNCLFFAGKMGFLCTGTHWPKNNRKREYDKGLIKCPIVGFEHLDNGI